MTDAWNIEVPKATTLQLQKLQTLLYLLDSVEASEMIVALKKRKEEQVLIIRQVEDGETMKGKI